MLQVKNLCEKLKNFFICVIQEYLLLWSASGSSKCKCEFLDRKSKHGQDELSGKHKIKLSSQEDFDQKQQKRIEREKQREEQRRRREERKKERQEARAKRSQSQSSGKLLHRISTTHLTMKMIFSVV